MHPAIAFLLPLLFLTTPLASTPEAAPSSEPPGGPLEIMAYPPGATPEVVPVRELGGRMDMQPGGTWQIVVGTVECCYVFTPGEQSAIWTVSPVDGVKVDDRGLLTVDESVPDGTVFTVTANRDPVGPSASLRVHVYTPEAQPLVGLWREAAHLACDTGEETAPETAIGELRFSADGTFSVTWRPFEIFVDYWGTYEANRASGTLKMTITSGFSPPPDDFDGEGRFEVRDDGSLTLDGIWLGSSPYREASEPGCGHVFTSWPMVTSG